MKIGAYLYFKIIGENLNFDEINSTLNILPSNIYRKGDVFKNRFVDVVTQEDCWSANYEIPEIQSLEDAMLSFIQPYIIQQKYITNLSKKYDVKLWISLYPDNNQMNINLSKKIITALYDLKIELEITAAYLSEFYDGNVK
jgi:hypothetical protein